MRMTQFAAAAAGILAMTAGAAIGIAERDAAAHAAPSRLHCGAHKTDRGISLAGLSRRSRVPVPILLWFDFRCSGYEGGGWTVRMAHYLEGANLHAPYRGWYWLAPLK